MNKKEEIKKLESKLLGLYNKVKVLYKNYHIYSETFHKNVIEARKEKSEHKEYLLEIKLLKYRRNLDKKNKKLNDDINKTKYKIIYLTNDNNYQKIIEKINNKVKEDWDENPVSKYSNFYVKGINITILDAYLSESLERQRYDIGDLSKLKNLDDVKKRASFMHSIFGTRPSV